MEQQEYLLSLNFFKAKGLAIGDVISSDPYLKVSLSPQIFTKTRPIFNTLNPTWDFEWHLSNIPLGSQFAIEVWDYDVTSKDDKIGTCSYTFDGKEGEQEVQVMHRGKKHGIITIKVACQVSKDAGAPRWIGPASAECHFSAFAGTIVNHRTDDSYRSYGTYKVVLPYTNTVFDTLVGWNKDYDNAKAIFAQGVKSAAVQNVVKSQHARLYIHDSTTIYSILRSGKEFLELFNYGTRKKVPRYYTYVIVPGGMYFSETGAAFFTDFMSKHAMHAKAVEEVCFAGEFHVQQKEGKYFLIIDNNSGTYAPPANKVQKLVELFKYNFSDLDVEAYDRDDPKLKEYKKIMSEFKEK